MDGWQIESFDQKISEKCQFSHHNNFALVKSISLFDTALIMTNIPKVSKNNSFPPIYLTQDNVTYTIYINIYFIVVFLSSFSLSSKRRAFLQYLFCRCTEDKQLNSISWSIIRNIYVQKFNKITILYEIFFIPFEVQFFYPNNIGEGGGGD